MGLIVAAEWIRWASMLGMAVALLLAIGARRRRPGKIPQLFLAAFVLLLAGWAITSFYAAILRFIFGLADPRGTLPWRHIAEAVASSAQVSTAAGYLLLAAGTVAFGRLYLRR